MNTGKIMFAQLMDHLPWTSFSRIVERHGGDRYVKLLRCTDQYRAMAFAQLTYREGLRDIQVCLSTQQHKLYHMGFRSPVRRSTLADANELRDWRIHAEFAQVLIKQARLLYAKEKLRTAPRASSATRPWCSMDTKAAATIQQTCAASGSRIPRPVTPSSS